MRLVAFLDTNALWSPAVRDLLLRAAESELYRALWSDRILGELAGSIKARRPSIDPARIDRMIGEMRAHFPEAEVDRAYEALIPSMRNYEGDRHVLAAAVFAGASVIVTRNEKHFPPETCRPYSIDVQSPDQFLCELWETNVGLIVQLLNEQAADLSNPRKTPQQVVEGLHRTVPRFADRLLGSGLL